MQRVVPLSTVEFYFIFYVLFSSTNMLIIDGLLNSGGPDILRASIGGTYLKYKYYDHAMSQQQGIVHESGVCIRSSARE